MATPSQQRETIFFDASCGLCSAGATRFERLLLRRGFSFEPLQSPGVAELLGLKAGEVPEEIKLRTVHGDILGGADAMARIARRIWWAWPVWLLVKVPGGDRLLQFLYQKLARHRHRLSAACGITPDHSASARQRRITLFLTILVAFVWIYHGLYSKLLHGHPRHLLIVQSVPGLAGVNGIRATYVIGIGEIALGIWVMLGLAPRAAATVQTVALLGMNVIELTWARQYLLWPVGLIPINLLFLTAAWIAATLRRAQPIFFALRRHPIPIKAHFRHCLVLTYAFPEATLRPFLPPGLQIDSLNGHGFLAVAIVQTESLRPDGLPKQLGRSFVLTGYRIFTKFKDGNCTRRGLRILRSDANKRMMVAGGNWLTHYNYQICKASVTEGESSLRVLVTTPRGVADLDVTADLSANQDAPLPTESPFTSAQGARRFAGPLPWTFDYEHETHSIIAIKGVRDEWRPRIVRAHVQQCKFLEQPEFAGAAPLLASAFYISDIDYRWERGVRHPLAGESS